MANRLKWGTILFVAVAVLLTELVCEHGRVSWGPAYWIVVGAALWGALIGYRRKCRTESKITKLREKKLPAFWIDRARDEGSLISMLTASAVAFLGIVIRFMLHGTRWQATPFYVLGLALLFFSVPREFPQGPGESNI